MKLVKLLCYFFLFFALLTYTSTSIKAVEVSSYNNNVQINAAIDLPLSVKTTLSQANAVDILITVTGATINSYTLPQAGNYFSIARCSGSTYYSINQICVSLAFSTAFSQGTDLGVIHLTAPSTPGTITVSTVTGTQYATATSVLPSTGTIATINVSTITSNSNSPSQNSNSISEGDSHSTVCNSEKPTSMPDLFQINPGKDKVTLYFSPVSGQHDRYYISYGTVKEKYEYGYEFKNNQNGVISATINLLKKNTVYYFKVRGGNNCMPGEWSNVLPVKTGQFLPVYKWSSIKTIFQTNVANIFSNNKVPTIGLPQKPVLKSQKKNNVITKTDTNIIDKVTNLIKSIFKYNK